MHVNGLGHGFVTLRENVGAYDLLNSLDLFDEVKGKKLDEVKGKKLSIKKLYEKFRGSNSHGVVSLPFLCVLNVFLNGKKRLPKML